MERRIYQNITLSIYQTREEMGRAAAREAADYMTDLIDKKQRINCVLAAAPSQNEFLKALAEYADIDWGRVNAFHMDEYVGFAVGDRRAFNGYLSRHIFEKVPFGEVFLINGEADPEAECRRYGALLWDYPPDIVFMGIGENGHIAFNDPEVADFEDAELVKAVKLARSCRQQQVNDGCFARLEDVPTHAITLTIPALLNAQKLFCMVPGIRKAQAVRNALTGPVSERCPASILQTKPGTDMYLDAEAASLLP